MDTPDEVEVEEKRFNWRGFDEVEIEEGSMRLRLERVRRGWGWRKEVWLKRIQRDLGRREEVLFGWKESFDRWVVGIVNLIASSGWANGFDSVEDSIARLSHWLCRGMV